MTAEGQPTDAEPSGVAPLSSAPAAPTYNESADALEALAQPGLSWSWKLDFQTLLTALTTPAVWDRPSPAQADLAQTDPTCAAPIQDDPADIDPAEADFADYLDAVESGRSGP